MSAIDAYLTAAEHAVAMLEKPEVAAAWGQPSALAEMTLGGLAGHLANQIFSVGSALEAPAAAMAPIPLLEHYARAAWINAPLDGEVNAGIRARGEKLGSEGAQPLSERARASLAEQRTTLSGRSVDDPVFQPQAGWALRLDDFLTMRTMELVVHMDDLAVSVGLPARELPDAIFDPVLVLLARLAVLRHGQAALLRALTRAERAPAAINAM